MSQRAVIFVAAVDVIEIDSVLDESHTLTSTVTDHPVENGFNISDHSRPDPDTVSLRCFVSNTPLSAEQQSRAVREGDYQFQTSSLQDVPIGAVGSRGDSAYQKLKQLRATGALVKVVTSLTTYKTSDTEGMTITSISIPRTLQNYDGLEFTLALKQIRIVKNRSTTDQKQKVKKARPRVKVGAKPTTEVAPVDNRTAAAKIMDTGGVQKMLGGLSSGLGL